MTSKQYVFGYGSIVNPKSMAKDIDPKSFTTWVQVQGYERIFDWPVDGSLALNLRPNANSTIDGILVVVDEESLQSLIKREKGYTLVDITDNLVEKMDGKVLVFIAPNEKHPDLTIAKDYYDLCLNAIPKAFQKEWLKTTVIENAIS